MSYKIDGKHVQAIDPWTAKGPGWSNAGVTIVLYHPDGSMSTKTIYEKDLGRDSGILFRHAVSIIEDLKKSVTKDLGGERVD